MCSPSRSLCLFWSYGLPRTRVTSRRTFGTEWPTYLAYVAAFAMIGSVWLHHHLVFARVRQVDIGTILTNLLLLFTVSVLPFPTAVMSSAWRHGERSDKIAASLLFALLSIAISAAYIGLCSYLARRD